MHRLLRLYGVAYRQLWSRFGIRRGHGWLLDQITGAIRNGDYDVDIQTKDGRHFRGDIRNSRYRSLFWHSAHEPVESELVSAFLRPSDICLDVGANIGWYTILAARMAQDGFVYAFEPIPEVARDLAKNVLLNELTNVSIEKLALADTSGNGEIWFCDHEWGLSSLGHAQAGGQRYPIRLATLDEWVQTSGLSQLDFVKVDIEGGEAAFLRGGQDTLGRLAPIIMMEINTVALENSGSTAAEVLEMLSSLRYRLFSIATSTPASGALNEIAASTPLESQFNLIAAPDARPDLNERVLSLAGHLRK